eukprot:scaffold39431_cov34-Tisochrysis_lutea.AAC.2
MSPPLRDVRPVDWFVQMLPWIFLTSRPPWSCGRISNEGLDDLLPSKDRLPDLRLILPQGRRPVR